MNREKRPEEKPIQPPMMRDIYLKIDDQLNEYMEDENINWIGDQNPTFYIIEAYYTNSLTIQENYTPYEYEGCIVLHSNLSLPSLQSFYCVMCPSQTCSY